MSMSLEYTGHNMKMSKNTQLDEEINVSYDD